MGVAIAGKEPSPTWPAQYIGLPFQPHGRDRQGLDCWGLVCLVYAEQYDITLPRYDGSYGDVTDPAELGQLIEAQRALYLAGGAWRPVEMGLEYLQAGDLMILRMMGAPMHCGIAVGPHTMLHIEQGIDASLADLRQSKWRPRLAPAPYGAYRHAALD